jgi:23S rRNA pseudouridine1911/1915/1917 synthase
MSTLDPPGAPFEVVVTAQLAGERLDRAVSLLLGVSRADSRARIERGEVSVDGEVSARGSLSLLEGQRLVVLSSAASVGLVPDGRVDVEVLYEDDDVIVVDKAPGIVVHPGAGQREGTLVAGLLARYPDLSELADAGLCEPERPGIVHRLDKGTSGLLVVARSARALNSLRAQIAERSITREYVGLAQGQVPDDAGVIDAPIGRSERQPTLMAVRADGRAARTHYRVRARGVEPSTSLLDLVLETGRTHQIRVHLAALGHPIVNDTRYGHRRDTRLEEGRLFLHASSLAFAHPGSSERVSFTSPLPGDLAALAPG